MGRLVALAVGFAVVASVGCGGDSSSSDSGASRDAAADAAADVPKDAPIEEPPAAVWTELTPCPRTGTGPMETAGAAAAWDPARGRLVTFLPADRSVWELDPAAGKWHARTPCKQPQTWPSFFSSHLAHDTSRARTVLVQWDSVSARSRVWDWRGDNGEWAERTPDSIPDDWPANPRGAAYDHVRKRLVLLDQNGVTWEWDGQAPTWVRADRGVQSPLAAGSMVFDERSGYVLAPALADGEMAVWGWNGTAGFWSRISTEPAPSRRGLPAFGWDNGRSRAVLFSGLDQPIPTHPDLWEWDSVTNTWADRTPDPLPAVWPLATVGATLATVGGDGVTLLGSNGSRGVSWGWDGVRWTPSSSATGVWPGPLRQAWMAFDARRGRFVVVGCADCNWPLTVWDWTGSAELATDRTPQRGSPGFIRPVNAAFAYDPKRGRVLVLATPHNPVKPAMFRTLQEWDPVTGAVTDRSDYRNPLWPRALESIGMVYDESRDRLVILAGRTLEWEGDTGDLVDRGSNSPASPADRNPTLAYDSARAKVLLLATGESPGTAWEWDGAEGTWTAHPCLAGNDCPSQRNGAAVAYHPARRRLVVFGGRTSAGQLLDELWEWDPFRRTWADRSPSPRPEAWPPPRAGAAMAYDPQREALVLYGGSAPRAIWMMRGSGDLPDRLGALPARNPRANLMSAPAELRVRPLMCARDQRPRRGG